MKRSLLLGLAALAFGGLTSCSNIMEESGINPVAIAKTGELGIALEADASVSVTTKAGTSDEVTLTDEEKKKFVIKGTKDGASSPIDLGTFADFANGAVKTVEVGTYSITAAYGTMAGELAFDNPTFEGTKTGVVVEANKTTENVTVTASLTNSIISIDDATFTSLKTSATITDLFAYSGKVEPTGESGKYSLLSADNNTLVSSTLYVKKGASDVNIVIKGTLKNDANKTFTHTANIKTLIGGNQNIEEAKNYNIKYSLSGDNGSLSLTINVNGNVTEEPISVVVNPYE
ncbi:DUF4493 domain-containing protein [Parabacteroides sp.]